MFAAQVHDIGGMAVLVVDGDVDLGVLPAWHSALHRAVASTAGATLVVDVDGVGSIDDAAWGVLVGAAAAARDHGGDVCVVCAGDALLARIQRLRIDRVVSVVSQLRSCAPSPPSP